MKVKLIVKAKNHDDAFDEFKKRITGYFVIEDVWPHHNGQEVWITALVADLDDLRYWFNSDLGAEPPFPQGALLYFTVLEA